MPVKNIKVPHCDTCEHTEIQPMLRKFNFPCSHPQPVWASTVALFKQSAEHTWEQMRSRSHTPPNGNATCAATQVATLCEMHAATLGYEMAASRLTAAIAGYEAAAGMAFAAPRQHWGHTPRASPHWHRHSSPTPIASRPGTAPGPPLLRWMADCQQTFQPKAKAMGGHPSPMPRQSAAQLGTAHGPPLLEWMTTGCKQTFIPKAKARDKCPDPRPSVLQPLTAAERAPLHSHQEKHQDALESVSCGHCSWHESTVTCQECGQQVCPICIGSVGVCGTCDPSFGLEAGEHQAGQAQES